MTWTSTCSSWSTPASPEGCRRLAAILHRPWAVLSAGVPFDQFTDIILIAAEDGGASGFIAGRSVWREVVGLAGPHREEFLTTVALPRLERLIEVAEQSARPWTDVAVNHQGPQVQTPGQKPFRRALGGNAECQPGHSECSGGH